MRRQHLVCLMGLGVLVISVVSSTMPQPVAGEHLDVQYTSSHVALQTNLFSARPALWRSFTWYFRETLSTGAPNETFNYSTGSSDNPLLCDWDGNGTRTPGVVNNGIWYIRNSISDGPPELSFSYGISGDYPICGDWDGNAVETVGVVRGGIWYLRNSNTSGSADLSFGYGITGDKPIVGDWNGDGVDTPGIVRNGTWYLRNTNTSGNADLLFAYGLSTDMPIVGDWNGDGIDTPGVFRSGAWFLRNTNTSGVADIQFNYGEVYDKPLVWKTLDPPLNRVIDADFETGLLSSWQPYLGSINLTSIGSNHTPGGQYEAYVQTNGGVAAIFQWITPVPTPLRNYRLGAWVRTSSNNVTAYLSYYSDTKGTVICQSTNSQSYVPLGCELTVPAGTANLQVNVYINAAAGERAYVDDFYFVSTNNLIQNPNFEEGMNGWQSNVQWGVASGSNNHTPGGNWYGYIGPGSSPGSVYQFVPAEANVYYRLRAYANSPDGQSSAALSWTGNSTHDCESKISIPWSPLSCRFYADYPLLLVLMTASGPPTPSIRMDDWTLEKYPYLAQIVGLRSVESPYYGGSSAWVQTPNPNINVEWAAVPIATTNLTVFIESGPMKNCEQGQNCVIHPYTSWHSTNGSSGQQIDDTMTMVPGVYYYYRNRYVGGNRWHAEWCVSESVCHTFLQNDTDLGVSRLNYVFAGTEAQCKSCAVGSAYIASNRYYSVLDGQDYPWCYTSGLNNVGGVISRCGLYQDWLISY